MKFSCTDGQAEIEIEAATPREAAREYVDGGDWGEAENGTQWVDVRVKNGRGTWEYTITVFPPAPPCAAGDDGENEHDWQSPYAVLGGIAEHPGVGGNGGGVIIQRVCARCGRYRITDTWAQRPDTGEQGLESVAYRAADEKSGAWVARRRAEAA